MPDRDSTERQRMREAKELLAHASAIHTACELDVLVFLHRHPRTLLTNDQLATFVGYDSKQVAATIDAFMDAGLLERTQNRNHAARMYLLLPDGPHGGGAKALVKLASTRSGRRDLLELLSRVPARSVSGGADGIQEKRRLHAIA